MRMGNGPGSRPVTHRKGRAHDAAAELPLTPSRRPSAFYLTAPTVKPAMKRSRNRL